MWQRSRVLVVLAASSLQQASEQVDDLDRYLHAQSFEVSRVIIKSNGHGGHAVGHRLLRINESIKEILSSVITAEGLKDPRVGFVTVTGVETTPDLRHAKVYVSVLGKQAERDACMEALEHSRGYLQARLNAVSRA